MTEPNKHLQAWTDFCDQLKQAGQVLLREDLELNDFDQLEGVRYLSRLTRAGLQTFAELSGPRHPAFKAMPELVKMGLDNPDNWYVGASIKADFDYRITGNRGTIHYLSFAAQNQNFAARDNISGGAGHLNDSELEMDAEGNFEIIASQQPQSGNWLKLAPDTSQILCRQTYLDRGGEQAAVVDIECLAAEGPPPPLDSRRFAGQLLGAAMYAEGTASWFADWVVDMANHAGPNELYLPPAEQHRLVGGDPNVRIYLGRWQLEPDQALIVDLQPPVCDYWNFQLGNIWAESLDYSFRPVHINSGQATAKQDGSVQLVISGQNPGADNWLDTASHVHGTMCVRWVRAESHPQPTCRVVPLASLS
jgi:hypothetical protein